MSVPPELVPYLEPAKSCLEPLGVKFPPSRSSLFSPGTRRKRSEGNTSKRAAISAEAGAKIDSAAKLQIIEKTAAQRATIAKAIDHLPAFSSLPAEMKRQVIGAFFEKKATTEENIIVQGDMGDNFYVVASGEYCVLIKQRGRTPVRFYEAGDSFGELALMYNTPRAATVQCMKGGTLWGLDRESFRLVHMQSSKTAAENTSQARTPNHCMHTG